MGCTTGDIHHHYACHDNTDFEIDYTNGRWRIVYDHWLPVLHPLAPRECYEVLAVPLCGYHQLLISSCALYDRDPMTVQVESRDPDEFWVCDSVSQDLVALEPLSIPEGTSLVFATVTMVNPTTLMILHEEYTMVVDIDPHIVSPEYHTSMVGQGAWRALERQGSESADESESEDDSSHTLIE
ncbi:hypothetical protein KIPB_005864 [Kipferlia bialata]|uniref:Uncharacterized protein n=1 Tax=Kipferlia bialata TaxID=797122 RepID=A0A391NRN8_9EUKA|nr:hypothetical protein KIPB_005864 [Kipferlia bialata]|eukprot:g5864.t1